MSSNIILRPYQNILVNLIRRGFSLGKKSILVVAPTGAGKTVMFSYMAHHASQKNNKVLLLAHREELVNQISETLSMFNCDHGFITAKKDMDNSKMVQVGSVFTVVNRFEKMNNPDLVILDEAHHFSSGNTWSRILDNFKGAKIIGVTATPCRTDGKPLKDIFDEMIVGPSVADLIKLGSLSDYRAFAPALIQDIKMKVIAGDYSQKETDHLMNDVVITGHAVREWKSIANGKKTIVFCSSVDHAKNVAQMYIEHGISAASLDGESDPEERSRVLNKFKAGDITVLTNCALFTEGFDCKTIDCVQLLRPTASLSLYLQMVGRGLRVYEGKGKAIIIDHVRAIEKHGLPDQHREWSLTEPVKKRSGKAESPVQICPQCFAAVPISSSQCSECGHEFKKQSKEDTKTVDENSRLSEIDKEAMLKAKKLEQGQAKTLEDLIKLGKQRGYKNATFWARKVFESRRRR